MTDISNSVTVFLISGGNNPNYPLCVEALSRQTVSFETQTIKDIHPLVVAKQEMLNRCRTPYYVELDQDMILNPDAVAKMHATITGEPEDTATCCFRLHDVHLDFDLYGVKIHKHGILTRYPYNPQCLRTDVEQLARAHKDGYRCKMDRNVLGAHAPLWKHEAIFERYFNLMEKHKEDPYEWLSTLPAKLWRILRETPNEQNLCALLGAFVSIMQPAPLQEGDKDYTRTLEEFLAAKRFLG